MQVNTMPATGYALPEQINRGVQAVVTDMVKEAYTDKSATPGAATITTPRGRVSFKINEAAITVTHASVTAASQIYCNLIATDTALTNLLTCAPGDGSFVITANAAATGGGLAKVDFTIINS